MQRQRGPGAPRRRASTSTSSPTRPAATASPSRSPSKEFDLLVHFLANPGQAFRREELLESVWGWTFGDTATVTVHVRRLREKLEDDPSDPRHLLTVRGIGYRFEP